MAQYRRYNPPKRQIDRLPMAACKQTKQVNSYLLITEFLTLTPPPKNVDLFVQNGEIGQNLSRRWVGGGERFSPKTFRFAQVFQHFWQGSYVSISRRNAVRLSTKQSFQTQAKKCCRIVIE